MTARTHCRRSAHAAAALAAGVLLLLLSGCGGGGDNAGTGTGGFAGTGDTVDAMAAWQNLLTTSRSWSVSGTDNFGRTVSVTFAVAPGATSAFPPTGASASRSDATITTTTAGLGSVTVLQETFFEPGSLRIVGLRRTVGGAATCDVATGASEAPPSAAGIPSSGALASLDERSGCLAGSSSVGTVAVTWSLEAENGIAFFCVNSTESRAGAVVSFEQDCVQVSASGALGTAARITMQQGGVTLVAR